MRRKRRPELYSSGRWTTKHERLDRKGHTQMTLVTRDHVESTNDIESPHFSHWSRWCCATLVLPISPHHLPTSPHCSYLDNVGAHYLPLGAQPCPKMWDMIGIIGSAAYSPVACELEHRWPPCSAWSDDCSASGLAYQRAGPSLGRASPTYWS